MKLNHSWKEKLGNPPVSSGCLNFRKYVTGFLKENHATTTTQENMEVLTVLFEKIIMILFFIAPCVPLLCVLYYFTSKRK